MKKFTLPMVILAVCSTTGPLCRGQVISNSYGDSPLPDPGSVTQPIGNGPNISSVDQISVSLRHTFVGDLTIKVTAPGGAQFTLIDRPGFGQPDTPEGYGTNVGADNYPADAPTASATYTFAASGLSFNSAADTDSTQEVPSNGTYAANSWPSGPFTSGTWQISITDSSVGDSGVLSAAQVMFTPVPEPGESVLATALLLTSFVCCRRRFRNRKESLSS